VTDPVLNQKYLHSMDLQHLFYPHFTIKNLIKSNIVFLSIAKINQDIAYEDEKRHSKQLASKIYR
jgi:hypothetical protein